MGTKYKDAEWKAVKGFVNTLNDDFRRYMINIDSFYNDLNSEEFKANLTRKINSTVPAARSKYDSIVVERTKYADKYDIFIKIMKNKTQILHVTLHFGTIDDPPRIGSFHIKSNEKVNVDDSIRLALEISFEGEPSLKFVNKLEFLPSGKQKIRDGIIKHFVLSKNDDFIKFSQCLVDAINDILPDHIDLHKEKEEANGAGSGTSAKPASSASSAKPASAPKSSFSPTGEGGVPGPQSYTGKSAGVTSAKPRSYKSAAASNTISSTTVSSTTVAAAPGRSRSVKKGSTAAASRGRSRSVKKANNTVSSTVAVASRTRSKSAARTSTRPGSSKKSGKSDKQRGGRKTRRLRNH